MPKQEEGKRVTFQVEMYWRGKTQLPSVSVIYEGPNYPGLPGEINTARFDAGCKDLCQQLIDAGELDN